MGNPEIQVGKSNGSRHSGWGASENMACDLRGYNVFTLYSLFSWFGYTLWRVFLPPRQILYLYDSTRVVCVAYEWFCDETFEHHIVEPLMSIWKTQAGETKEPLWV